MTDEEAQICPLCKHPIQSPMDAVGFPRSIELENCRVPEMSEAVTHYSCVFGLMKFNDLISDIIDFYKQLHPLRDRIKVADRNVIYYIKEANDLRLILLNSYVRCSVLPEKAPDLVADLQALYLGKPATRTGLCSAAPNPGGGGGTPGEALMKRRNIFLHFSKDLTTLTPQGIRIQRALDFVDVRALEKLLPEFGQMADSAKIMSAFKKNSTPPPLGAGGAMPDAPRVTRAVNRNPAPKSQLEHALHRIQKNFDNDPAAEPYSPPRGAPMAQPGAAPVIPHPGQMGVPARPGQPIHPQAIPHPTAQVQHLTPIPQIPAPNARAESNTPQHAPTYARAFETHVGGSPLAAQPQAQPPYQDEPGTASDVEAAVIGIVTVSDRASRGQYEDLGGPAVAAFLDETLTTPFQTVRTVIPDEPEQLRAILTRMADKDGCCLILTTGGTGPAARDITPEVTEEICDKILPGFGEEMRRVSLQYVPTAILSRQIAGVRGKTLIINLPGRPKSIRECLMAIFAAVPYCVDLIDGPRLETNPGVVKTFRPEKK